MEDNQQEVYQDFRIRYQILINDIKYIKSRQWAVTYYLLLIFFAIIGFYEALGIENMNVSEPIIFLLLKLVLSLIAAAVPIVGLYFLKEFNRALARYREELADGVLENLTPAFVIKS